MLIQPSLLCWLSSLYNDDCPNARAYIAIRVEMSRAVKANQTCMSEKENKWETRMVLIEGWEDNGDALATSGCLPEWNIKQKGIKPIYQTYN